MHRDQEHIYNYDYIYNYLTEWKKKITSVIKTNTGNIENVKEKTSRLDEKAINVINVINVDDDKGYKKNIKKSSSLNENKPNIFFNKKSTSIGGKKYKIINLNNIK